MAKYLFNDGTNPIQEVHSKEDLDKLAAQADPRRATVWVFPSDEWISLARFRELYTRPLNGHQHPVAHRQEPARIADRPAKKKQGSAVPWKMIFAVVFLGLIFTLYLVNRPSAQRLHDETVRAERPENTPPINVDSLIKTIEASRGKALDKTTQTNLRIRNTWPEQILVSVKAEREKTFSSKKFKSIEFTLDNATGYLIDELEAELSIWKDGFVDKRVSVRFEKTDYTQPKRISIPNEYVGDSMSVRVLGIKAKSFNFCYSHDKQSNYGNLADRWFCR